MGRVYCEDDLYEHEGYLAAILPDRTTTSTRGYGIPTCIGHVPECSCGWRGTATYVHAGRPRRRHQLSSVAGQSSPARRRPAPPGPGSPRRTGHGTATGRARRQWDEIGVALYPLPTNPVRWYLGEGQADEAAS